MQNIEGNVYQDCDINEYHIDKATFNLPEERAVIEILRQSLEQTKTDLKLFNKMIGDEIQECEKLLLNSKFELVAKRIDTIFTYGLDGLNEPEKDQLYYLRAIGFLIKDDNEAYEECKKIISEELRQELNSIEHAALEEISELKAVSQVVKLNDLLKRGEYDRIIDISNNREIGDNEDLNSCWDYYNAIALFNLRRHSEASELLLKLLDKYDEDKYKLIYLLSHIEVLMESPKTKTIKALLSDDYNKLRELLVQNPTVKTGNEGIIAIINLQCTLILKPENFIEAYNAMDDKFKNSENVLLLLGMYYEGKNEYDKALNVYEKVNYYEISQFAERVIFCNIMQGEWELVVSVYSRLKIDHIPVVILAMYLQALYHVKESLYMEEIRSAAEKYKNDMNDFYYIAIASEMCPLIYNELVLGLFSGDIKNYFDDLIPTIRLSFTTMLLADLDGQKVIDLLGNVEQYKDQDDQLLKLFASKLYHSKAVEDKYKEDICTKFINYGICVDDFSRLKIHVLVNQQKYLSAISSLKQIYDNSNDLDDAYRILALAIEYDSSNIMQYKKYMNVLEDSRIPTNMIVVAAAYFLMGKTEEADKLIYESVVLLNGKDDFDIYNGVVSLRFRTTYEHRNKTVEYNAVTIDSAVFLKSNEETRVICVEKENELINYSGNNGCDAMHITYKDKLYYSIIDKVVGETIVIDGKAYTIVKILDKYSFAFQYALNKLKSTPENFKMYFREIEASSGEELLKKIDEITAQEKENNCLDLYLTMNNEIGFPIEVVANGNYDDYPLAVKALLFQENMALYAGEASMVENFSNQRFSITISSLVILHQLGMIDLIDLVKDRMVIPESVIAFLKARVDDFKKSKEISPGKLVKASDSGGYIILPQDETIIEMWSELLELCVSFELQKVTTEELVEFPFVDGMTAESLFASLKLDRSQLDTMVVAKKENAVLLCDDLFYRRIANILEIRNSNLSALLYEYNEIEPVDTIERVKKLAKTNYIYIPMIYDIYKDAEIIWQDLMTGQYKQHYYGIFLNDAIRRVFEQS